MRFCGGVPLLSLFFCAKQSTSAADCYGSPYNNCRRHVLRHKLCKHRLSVILNILYLCFCFLFFLRRLCGGRVSYVFSFMFMLLLMLMLMFMFIPIPMLLLLLFSFCFGFGFGFDSGFYSYLPLLRVFVSYRKEVVRFPIDLSGRGTEQRFCVFLPVFSVIGPARRSVRPCCLPKARLFCAVGRSDPFS